MSLIRIGEFEGVWAGKPARFQIVQLLHQGTVALFRGSMQHADPQTMLTLASEITGKEFPGSIEVETRVAGDYARAKATSVGERDGGAVWIGNTLGSMGPLPFEIAIPTEGV